MCVSCSLQFKILTNEYVVLPAAVNYTVPAGNKSYSDSHGFIITIGVGPLSHLSSTEGHAAPKVIWRNVQAAGFLTPKSGIRHSAWGMVVCDGWWAECAAGGGPGHCAVAGAADGSAVGHYRSAGQHSHGHGFRVVAEHDVLPRQHRKHVPHRHHLRWQHHGPHQSEAPRCGRWPHQISVAAIFTIASSHTIQACCHERRGHCLRRKADLAGVKEGSGWLCSGWRSCPSVWATSSGSWPWASHSPSFSAR